MGVILAVLKAAFPLQGGGRKGEGVGRQGGGACQPGCCENHFKWPPAIPESSFFFEEAGFENSVKRSGQARPQSSLENSGLPPQLV